MTEEQNSSAAFDEPKSIDILDLQAKNENNIEVLEQNNIKKTRNGTIALIIEDISTPAHLWIDFYHNAPDWLKIIICYAAIILLSVAGALIFYIFENKNAAADVKKYDDALRTLNNTFNATQLTFIHETWDPVSQQFMDANMWEFRYSTFYASTVFTTIGFGFQAPTTFLGRLFTILYSFPSIIIYGNIASNIGVIVIDCIETASIYAMKMNEDQWHRYRILCYIGILFTLFIILAKVIQITAVNEGFGKGIVTHWDAIYFLWSTSSTIGYGDKMMSGAAHPLVTMLFGMWIVSFCGMGIALLSFMQHRAEASLVNTYENKKEQLESQKIIKTGVQEHLNEIDSCIDEN